MHKNYGMYLLGNSSVFPWQFLDGLVERFALEGCVVGLDEYQRNTMKDDERYEV